MARNFIVLDTEGVDTIKRSASDGVHPETSLFYDFGYIVVNGKTFDILERHSFVNSDVFFDTSLMASAYYAEKLPQYYNGLAKEWMIADTKAIWDCFCDSVKVHSVKDIYAYNARYDMTITNNTIKTVSNGFRKFFAPYGTQWRDIWDYAGYTITNTKKYVKWCIANGFVSDKGNPSTSAETVYQYLTHDVSFKEAHTALSDCEIELEILKTCKKRKDKKPKTKGQGWRNASKIAKSL